MARAVGARCYVSGVVECGLWNAEWGIPHSAFRNPN